MQLVPPLKRHQCCTLPEACKDLGKHQLRWDLQHKEEEGDKDHPAHLLVHQVGEDDDVQGGYPQEGEEEEGLQGREDADNNGLMVHHVTLCA